jgi:PKD repeat protein
MKAILSTFILLSFSLLSYSQYCIPVGNCNSSVHISNVTLGDINNNTTCDSYGDYTSESTDLVIGSTGNSLSITPKNNSWETNSYIALWIDFNGDEDFEDAGEQLFADLEVPKDVPYIYSLDIPGGLSVGNVRMRVSMVSVPGGWLDWLGPCGDLPSSAIEGEFEDYNINLLEATTALEADFSGNPMTVVVGESVDFTDATIGGTEPYTYNWNFIGGNPASSTDESPQNITYNSTGTYQVILQVTDDNLNTDTEIKNNYITVVNTPPSVAISNWAIFAFVLLIGGFIIVRTYIS